MILSKDKNFYKLIFSIAIPITFQNLISLSVNMADTIMLGTLGEVELSAASIGGQLFFILMVLMMGLGSGANVMSAQYFGKGDMKSIHKILSLTYILATLLSVVFFIVGLFFSKEFMYIFTNDNRVIEKGISYIRICSLSYIFFSITIISTNVLRAVKKVKIPVVINGISLVINVILNYILILGKFKIQPMGIKGAAIATLVARTFECFLIVIYILYFEDMIKFKIKYIIKRDSEMLKKYIKVTTPIFFNELFWCIGSSTITFIVAKMGTDIVAANSINNIVYQFSLLFIQGVSSSASVIIGNTIGEGDYEKVIFYSKQITNLSIICGILASSSVIIMKDILVEFYNVSENTKLIAKYIMLSTSIVVLFKSLSSNLLFGILRGAGDNKFVFKWEMTSLWVFAIPLGMIGAFYFKFSVPIVFLLLKIDEIIKGIIGYIIVNKGKWINDIT